MERERVSRQSQDSKQREGYDYIQVQEDDAQQFYSDDLQDDSEYIRVLEVLENIEGFRDQQQLMDVLKQFNLNLLSQDQLDLVQKLVNNISTQLQFEIDTEGFDQQQTQQSLKQNQAVVRKSNAQMSIQDIKELLKTLFDHYSMRSGQISCESLKSRDFHKLMGDAGLLNSSDELYTDPTTGMTSRLSVAELKKRIDLIYCSVTSHCLMSFEQFLQSVLKMAQFKFPQYDQQNSINFLTSHYFLPLYQSIQETRKSDPLPIKARSCKPLFEYDEMVNLLLRESIGRVLYEVYKLYFPHELKGSGDYVSIGKESQKALNILLREYDICPGLVTKASVFNMLVDDSNATPLYTPTGLYIIARLFGKDFDASKAKQPTVIGKYLTFFKFLDIIVQIAIGAFSDPYFSKNRGQPLIAAEMVVLILERMELSPGFSQLEKKTNRTHQAKVTLLPSRAIVSQIKAAKDMIFASTLEQKPALSIPVEPTQIKKLQTSPPTNRPKTAIKNITQKQTLISELEPVQRDLIKRIFSYYASFGEPMNSDNLKSSKLIKLLKDAGLLKQGVLQDHSLHTHSKGLSKRQKWQTIAQPLTTVQADLIFKRLTGNEKPKGNILLPSRQNLFEKKTVTQSLQLDQFINALVQVGRISFNHLESHDSKDLEILFRLIDEFLVQLDVTIQSSDRGITHNAQLQIQNLLEILKDESIVDLLGVVHKTMLPYYRFYANSKGLIDLDAFVRFCSDFGIFPDILSKPKVYRFFKTLSTFYQEPNKSQAAVIDEHLFIEALALTAFEVIYKDPQPENAEKVVLLVERLNHSKGPQKVQMAIGMQKFAQYEAGSDLTSLLKASYPQYFEVDPQHTQQKPDLFAN